MRSVSRNVQQGGMSAGTLKREFQQMRFHGIRPKHRKSIPCTLGGGDARFTGR
jgi:hypothetical protein